MIGNNFVDTEFKYMINDYVKIKCIFPFRRFCFVNNYFSNNPLEKRYIEGEYIDFYEYICQKINSIKKLYKCLKIKDRKILKTDHGFCKAYKLQGLELWFDEEMLTSSGIKRDDKLIFNICNSYTIKNLYCSFIDGLIGITIKSKIDLMAVEQQLVKLSKYSGLFNNHIFEKLYNEFDNMKTNKKDDFILTVKRNNDSNGPISYTLSLTKNTWCNPNNQYEHLISPEEFAMVGVAIDRLLDCKS